MFMIRVCWECVVRQIRRRINESVVGGAELGV